ncbi:MAG: ScaI family restriction endonuclease [Bacteroidetes bacterium]|nr:MAG: ScaI family restriction endonuclease [Bacteroidota bacterium]
MKSPYENKNVSEWKQITENLLAQNPIYEKREELVKIIFDSKICALQLGKDFIPSYSNLGFFIENLTALKLAEKYTTQWKHGKDKNEKDIVCLDNSDFSIEVKSSSSSKYIFGNRSYAQAESKKATKEKSGFYLAINYEKFKKNNLEVPQIVLIRLGFVEHSGLACAKICKRTTS